jgi:hypothetical protein
MLGALVRRDGGEVAAYDMIQDDPDSIRGLPGRLSDTSETVAGVAQKAPSAGVHTGERVEQTFSAQAVGVTKVTGTLVHVTADVGFPGTDGGGEMGKQAEVDREARLEWLRAQAAFHNSEARTFELEIDQIGVLRNTVGSPKPPRSRGD